MKEEGKICTYSLKKIWISGPNFCVLGFVVY